MEPVRLLDAWTSVQGALSAKQWAAFLERQEVTELSLLPEPAVIHALGKASNLTAILQIATKEGWWYKGEACEEDNLPFC